MRNLVCKILFLNLLSNVIGYSQSVDTSDLRKYFIHVNKAELFITQEKIDAALKEYRQSFQYNKKPFSYDLYNAIICSSLKQNFIESIDLCKKLMLRGIKSDFFTGQSAFNSLTSSFEWKKFIEIEYANYINVYKSEINNLYREQIEKLYNNDQDIRKEVYSVKNGKLHFDSLKLLTTDIKSVDDIVLEKLDILLSLYGFPSDEKVGLWFRNDTSIAYFKPIDFVLIHQIKNQQFKLLNDLRKYVLLGDLHPTKLIQYSTGSNGTKDSTLKCSCLGLNQSIFFQYENTLYTCNDFDTKQININRNRLFLEPVDDLITKIEYYYEKNKTFKLNISLATVEIFDEKDISKYNLKFYKKLNSKKSYFK